MAGYSKDIQEKINTAQDLRDQMRFAGDQSAIKGGIEIEFHFQDQRNHPEALTLASDARVRDLKRFLNRSAPVMVDEMGGQMGEIATEAYHLQDLPALMREITNTRRTIVDAALSMDLKPSPYAVLADYDHRTFLENIICPTPDHPQRGERQRAMLQGFACHLTEESVDYPIQNSAIHVSHGARDLQHYYECYRRNAVLMPFLMMVNENRPPFIAGQKQDTHQGIVARSALGQYGLVPPVIFQARDAEDFVSRYYDSLLSRPMLAYLDGDHFRAATERGVTPPSFKQLSDRGLNTLSNAFQAMSMDWPCLKLSKIRNAAGHILGDRLETRDIDPGGHQPYSAALSVLLPALDPGCGAAIDDLLAMHGFDLNHMSECHVPLTKAFVNANDRGNLFLDVEYGLGTMQDFARGYAQIIKYYAKKHDVLNAAKPLLHICETGETDAKILARDLKTYDAVLNFQRNYNPELLRGGPTCLSLLRDEMGLYAPAPRAYAAPAVARAMSGPN